MELFLKWLFHFCRLLTRFYLKPYNKYWDAVLLKFLTEGEIKLNGDHTCIVTLNGKDLLVWVSNKFYSYGYEYKGICEDSAYRPSFSTMLLLESKVDGLRNKEQKQKEELYSERMRDLFTQGKS